MVSFWYYYFFLLAVIISGLSTFFTIIIYTFWRLFSQEVDKSRPGLKKNTKFIYLVSKPFLAVFCHSRDNKMRPISLFILSYYHNRKKAFTFAYFMFPLRFNWTCKNKIKRDNVIGWHVLSERKETILIVSSFYFILLIRFRYETTLAAMKAILKEPKIFYDW